MNNVYCSIGLEKPSDLNFIYTPNFVRRAGIVPFMVHHKTTYVLLGLSKEKNPVWADLGGRCEKDETPLQTAVREFKEESRNVLPIDLNRIQKMVLTDNPRHDNYDQMILFIQVDPTEHNIFIDKSFQNTSPRTRYEDEMTVLRWIPYYNFLQMGGLSTSLKLVKDTLLDHEVY